MRVASISKLLSPLFSLLHFSCRWGNSRSPAYGTLSDYQFMRRHQSSEKRRKEARGAWGDALNNEQDVADVFVKYCKVRQSERVCDCVCVCVTVEGLAAAQLPICRATYAFWRDRSCGQGAECVELQVLQQGQDPATKVLVDCLLFLRGH